MKNKVDRRQFLKGAVASVGFPYLIKSSAVGLAGTVAPSNRITLGAIGFGYQGGGNTSHLDRFDDVEVIGLCDVDRKTLGRVFAGRELFRTGDFRELIARDDIDTITYAVPDHWHGLIAVEAARAGKDIYGEKPISHNLTEARQMVKTMQRYGTVFQTGSWRRSLSKARFACELVRNGYIGKVHTVEVGLINGFNPSGAYAKKTPMAPPAELDYDMWLGPAPVAEYCPGRCHFNWRFNAAYGGGTLMDFVNHYLDIAHWGMGTDKSAPTEVEAEIDYPQNDPLWDAPEFYSWESKYPNGVTVKVNGRGKYYHGSKWIGDEGWVYTSGGDTIEASNPAILKEKLGPDKIHLYESKDHWRNFIDCVKTRQETICPIEISYSSCLPGFLAMISGKLGRKIYFDPETDRIINDPEATAMATRPMRGPWSM